MEAYAVDVRGVGMRVLEQANVHVVSDSSGPIERAMETVPALAVERLSIPEAYRIGRALRFVGFVLDQEQQRIKIGEHAHRLLRERSQMQANATARTQQSRSQMTSSMSTADGTQSTADVVLLWRCDNP